MTFKTRTTHAALAVLVAGSASAQPDMLITVDNFSGDQWEVSAEYFGTIFKRGIDQLWADTSFELTGDGSTITFTDYNPVYDTTLGPATTSNGPVASFIGNANLFFGTTDESNPLYVARFTYGGNPGDLVLDLVGQNSATFVNPPLGWILLYQDAAGDPGTLTWDVQYIPAPATLAVAPMALIATRRRRK